MTKQFPRGNNTSDDNDDNHNTESCLQTEGKVDWKVVYLEGKLQTLKANIFKLDGYVGNIA